MRSFFFAIMALTALLLGGCATSLGGSDYARADTRTEMRIRVASIVSVRDVHIEGTSTAGSIAGGLIGAIAGSALSNGKGSQLLAIAGAMGGAMLGNRVEKSATRANGQEFTLQLATGELVGITQENDGHSSFKKGDLVRVIGNGRTSRVGPM